MISLQCVSAGHRSASPEGAVHGCATVGGVPAVHLLVDTILSFEQEVEGSISVIDPFVPQDVDKVWALRAGEGDGGQAGEDHL